MLYYKLREKEDNHILRRLTVKQRQKIHKYILRLYCLLNKIEGFIINKLGYKVSPNSIENIIQSCKYVQECVVVGVEIADNDMVPIAFIELFDNYKDKKGVLHEIEELCKQKLKEYEIPRFFSEIDKIPHKKNGGKQDFLLLESLAKEIVSSS